MDEASSISAFGSAVRIGTVFVEGGKLFIVSIASMDDVIELDYELAADVEDTGALAKHESTEASSQSLPPASVVEIQTKDEDEES
ncbi:hypothetical protein Tcan_07866 [Toxocara canis]|uniref:Uncharacterized protein n=1 Tax=Toxocara canis TaxID=6265 RepID=A0A0B2W092_TOXCA|nr:hypothetical protein Tcan_07866 [Toxocara canis]